MNAIQYHCNFTKETGFKEVKAPKMNCLGSLMNYSSWDLKKIMYEGQCEETVWMVKLGDGGLINSVT